jgi:uncharacterized membrane protein YdjX (TVP38/TMEM64 family)
MRFAKLRRFGVICLLAVLLILAWSLFSIGHIDAKKALAMIQAVPALAPVVFMLVLAVSALLLLPLGLGLNLGAGIIWGGVLGGVWTTLGSLLAAVAGFLLARAFNGDYLKDPLETAAARSFLNSVKRHDWQVIFLVRLNPIVPFGLQNYLFGLSGIPLARYSVLSLFSCAIPAFLYASIGASINDLVLTGELKNLLAIAGAVLMLVTIGYLTRLYFRRGAVSG